MRRFFFPEQDAAIYEEFTTRQSGLDEILEVGKSNEGVYSVRSLIQFNVESISSSIADGTIPASASFDMKLFLARADKVKLDQVINLHPVTSSWKEGQGYFYEEPYVELDGVTWLRRETGSIWENSGSDYQASPTASASVTVPIADLTFDVSTIVRQQISGTLDNQGMLIKFPDSDENDGSNEGRMYFFSKDTHTVFLPTIIAKWNDQVYSTGSMTASSATDLTVYPNNLKPKYRQGEKVRVYLTSRQRSPLKTFSSTFSEWTNRALPTTVYYSVVDVQSQEEVIPFDDFSRVSVSSGVHYFDFVVEKMYPLRWYKVKIKVVNDGIEQVFDDRYQFMVTT